MLLFSLVQPIQLDHKPIIEDTGAGIERCRQQSERDVCLTGRFPLVLSYDLKYLERAGNENLGLVELLAFRYDTCDWISPGWDEDKAGPPVS